MPAYATNDLTVLRWENTAIISLDMQLNGSIMDCEGAIVGQAGTTSVSATYTLEKYVGGGYGYVDSWSDSGSGMVLATDKHVSGCTSGMYRLTVIGTVTKDGYAESVYNWLDMSW